MSMLVKFETRSNRVKGVSFHPKRTWVVCGLHNGVVQIWDYRMGSCIDRFEEHEGPVRGVDFHSQQPLFATGGDDYKIKIWNYKLRRCLFTLLGHLDYIRTVQFHREQPWLVSASDDQTVRIWNWQNRRCISVLTGHNHYVMSAQFHPRDDLIVSASLDLTLRVWDISGLRSKKQDSAIALPQDLFGSNDVVVKFILEGHEKGVNWASFHPTKPFIVSGADDRSIRLWKMDDSRTYEIEQLRGHTNNVSCVMFFKDLIVSNSEDRTVRVWNQDLRTAIQTFRRDNDRFWVLSVHPETNLLACGHDTGMLVFKLERERPPIAIHDHVLYWVKERTLRTYNFNTKAESSPVTLRRHNSPPITLSINPIDGAASAVLWYDYDGGIFELFNIPRPGTAVDADVKKGFYTSAVFFAANKFAALDKTRQIVIRTTGNDITKVLPGVGDSDRLFPGPQGCVLCRSEEKMHLFNLVQRTVIAEANIPKVKYVAWDKDFNKVAFLSKNTITVATRKFKIIATIHEPSKIKSAVFDEENEVLYYSTMNHLKYCYLRSSDTGTIRTLDAPVYLVKASGDNLWFITRDNKVVSQNVDNTELRFKIALHQEKFKDALKLIQSKKVHGQALVAYLHKHGYPEIAMHMVSDLPLRFSLALECGMLDVAKSAALEINKRECWQRLADAAIKFGDLQLTQLAHAKMQNFHALGLTCVMTGNTPALEQMISKARDENFALHYSMFTQDPRPRIALLEGAGQLPLAFSLARTHGLEEDAERLLSLMAPDVAERCASMPLPAVKAPAPVEPQVDNWPLLPIQESYVMRMLKEPTQSSYEESAPANKGVWGDDDLLDDDLGLGKDEPEDEFNTEPVQGTTPAIGGGQWDDDIELDALPSEPTQAVSVSSSKAFVMPREGDSAARHWVETSQLVAFHAAAGSFATAFDLLRRQIGLMDPEPLKPFFLQIWATANAACPTWSAIPSHVIQVTAPPPTEELRAKHAPRLPQLLPVIQERLKLGYQAVTEGRFPDALKIFQDILLQLLCVVVETKQEVNDIRELISVAREYSMALLVELQRKEEADPARSVELASYFTHFKLLPTHLILTMGQAMVQAFKAKCMKTAGVHARRLLDLDPPPDRAERARKVIQAADQNPTDAIKLDYDDRNPFVLCVVSKKPMYRGAVNPIRCSYCYAPSNPANKGKRCPVCRVATLGGEASGVINSASQYH